jgi:membrane associated rhomboid family serine protease
MFAQGNRSPIGFGVPLTPVGKTMLIGYAAIYVLELLFQHWLNVPVYQWLALGPFNSGTFRIWQVLTHPVIHNPGAPIGFLLNCLIFYFFAGTVESALGTRRFIRLYVIAAGGGALVGSLFSAMSAFNAPFSGMMPSLLSLIVIFGLMHPESTILLMFVLPVKAKFIAYATIAITTLTFLAKANPYGAFHLGGIVAAYLYFRPPSHLFNPNWWQWKRYERHQKKRRSRFTVIDGKKKKDDNKPTIH